MKIEPDEPQGVPEVVAGLVQIGLPASQAPAASAIATSQIDVADRGRAAPRRSSPAWGRGAERRSASNAGLAGEDRIYPPARSGLERNAIVIAPKRAFYENIPFRSGRIRSAVKNCPDSAGCSPSAGVSKVSRLRSCSVSF